MKSTDKNNLLKQNTFLWLVAMVLPVAFSLVFAATKFPWQIVSPLLLFGCLLASNKLIAQAIDQPASPSRPD